jgi:hypothetical protein
MFFQPNIVISIDTQGEILPTCGSQNDTNDPTLIHPIHHPERSDRKAQPEG